MAINPVTGTRIQPNTGLRPDDERRVEPQQGVPPPTVEPPRVVPTAETEFAPYAKKAEPTFETELLRGIRTGIANVYGTTQGTIAAGQAMLGFEEQARERLARTQQRTQPIYEANAPAVGKLADVYSEDTSFGDAINNARLYVAQLFGVQTPIFAQTALGGGIGGLAARRIGQRQLAKAATARLREEITAEGAEALRRQAVGRVATGAALGTGAASTTIQTGSIFTDIANDPEAAGTLQQQGALALVGGLATAGLDVLPNLSFLRRVGGANKVVTGSLIGRMAREAPRQALFEGITEGAQTIGERATHHFVNRNFDILGPEGASEVLEATGAGFILGGAMGAAGAAMSRPGGVEDSLAAEQESEEALNQIRLERRVEAARGSVPDEVLDRFLSATIVDDALLDDLDALLPVEVVNARRIQERQLRTEFWETYAERDPVSALSMVRDWVEEGDASAEDYVRGLDIFSKKLGGELSRREAAIAMDLVRLGLTSSDPEIYDAAAAFLKTNTAKGLGFLRDAGLTSEEEAQMMESMVRDMKRPEGDTSQETIDRVLNDPRVQEIARRNPEAARAVVTRLLAIEESADIPGYNPYVLWGDLDTALGFDDSYRKYNDLMDDIVGTKTEDVETGEVEGGGGAGEINLTKRGIQDTILSTQTGTFWTTIESVNLKRAAMGLEEIDPSQRMSGSIEDRVAELQAKEPQAQFEIVPARLVIEAKARQLFPPEAVREARVRLGEYRRERARVEAELEAARKRNKDEEVAAIQTQLTELNSQMAFLQGLYKNLGFREQMRKTQALRLHKDPQNRSAKKVLDLIHQVDMARGVEGYYRDEAAKHAILRKMPDHPFVQQDPLAMFEGEYAIERLKPVASATGQDLLEFTEDDLDPAMPDWVKQERATTRGRYKVMEELGLLTPEQKEARMEELAKSGDSQTNRTRFIRYRSRLVRQRLYDDELFKYLAIEIEGDTYGVNISQAVKRMLRMQRSFDTGEPLRKIKGLDLTDYSKPEVAKAFLGVLAALQSVRREHVNPDPVLEEKLYRKVEADATKFEALKERMGVQSEIAQLTNEIKETQDSLRVGVRPDEQTLLDARTYIKQMQERLSKLTTTDYKPLTQTEVNSFKRMEADKKRLSALLIAAERVDIIDELNRLAAMKAAGQEINASQLTDLMSRLSDIDYVKVIVPITKYDTNLVVMTTKEGLPALTLGDIGPYIPGATRSGLLNPNTQDVQLFVNSVAAMLREAKERRASIEREQYVEVIKKVQLILRDGLPTTQMSTEDRRKMSTLIKVLSRNPDSEKLQNDLAELEKKNAKARRRLTPEERSYFNRMYEHLLNALEGNYARSLEQAISTRMLGRFSLPPSALLGKYTQTGPPGTGPVNIPYDPREVKAEAGSTTLISSQAPFLKTEAGTDKPNVIIAGGRDWGLFWDRMYQQHVDPYNAMETFDAAMRWYLSGYDLDKVTVRHGGAQGVDEMAQVWSQDNGVNVETYLPDWRPTSTKPTIAKRNADRGIPSDKRAGFRRNTRMLDGATHLVAFWDGQSGGTKDMIDKAIEAGLDVRIYTYGAKLTKEGTVDPDYILPSTLNEDLQGSVAANPYATFTSMPLRLPRDVRTAETPEGWNPNYTDLAEGRDKEDSLFDASVERRGADQEYEGETTSELTFEEEKLARPAQRQKIMLSRRKLLASLEKLDPTTVVDSFETSEGSWDITVQDLIDGVREGTPDTVRAAYEYLNRRPQAAQKKPTPKKKAPNLKVSKESEKYDDQFTTHGEEIRVRVQRDPLADTQVKEQIDSTADAILRRMAEADRANKGQAQRSLHALQSQAKKWNKKLKLKGLRVVSTEQIVEILRKRGTKDDLAILESIYNNNQFGLSLGETVWVNELISAPAQTQALAHEMGHVLAYLSFNDNVKNMSSIMDSWNKWRAEVKQKGKLKDAATARSTLKMAIEERGTLSETRLMSLTSEELDYVLDFEEWFADQVAAWLIKEDAKPRNSVERWVDSFVGGMRELFAVSSSKAWVEPSVEAFIENAVLVNEHGTKMRVRIAMRRDIRSAAAVVATDPTTGYGHQAILAMLRTGWLTGAPANALGRVFSINSVINRKIQDRLRPFDPLAAERVATDVNEAIAFGFQLWTEGEIDLGPSGQKAFERLTDTVFRALGEVSDFEQAREVGDQVRRAVEQMQQKYPDDSVVDLTMRIEAAMKPENGGHRSNYTVSKVLKETRLQKIAQTNKELWGSWVANLLSKIFQPAAMRLLSVKNAALTDLVYRMYTPPGVRGRPEAYLQARSRQIASWLSRFARVTGELDADKTARIMKVLQEQIPTDNVDADIKQEITDIRKVFEDMYDYAARVGVFVMRKRGKNKRPGHRDLYFPWVYNREQLTDRRDEWIALMSDPAYEPYMKDILRDLQKTLVDPNDPESQSIAEERGITDIPSLAAWYHTKLVGEDGLVAPSAVEEATSTGLKLKLDRVGHVPFAAGINERGLNFLQKYGTARTKELHRSFLSQDLNQTLRVYTEQLVKRTEFQRRFFINTLTGETEIDELIQKAQDLGATKKDIELAEDFVAAVQGTLGIRTNAWLSSVATQLGFDTSASRGKVISPKLQLAFSVIVLWQNIRVLGLATFTSLADPVGILVRGGASDVLMASLRAGIGASDVSKYSTQVAHALGIIEAYTIDEALSSTFGTNYMVGRTRLWNEKFFHLIQLNRITRVSRAAATGGALAFIHKHSQNPTKHSERYLDELNLKASDVKLNDEGHVMILKRSDIEALWKIARNTTGQSNAAAIRLARAEIARDERVRAAIARFVDESILRPSAATRPIWASDPHYQLIFHLKSFMYTFHDVILRRVGLEAIQGNWAPMATLLWFVPIMIFADYTRDLFKFGGPDPKKADWGILDWSLHGMVRSGLPGLGMIVSDASKDVQYGGVGVESFLGPTFSSLRKADDLLLGPDRWDALLDQLPLNNTIAVNMLR